MNEIETLIQNGSFAAADAIANALPNAKANAMGDLLKKVFADKTIPGTNVQTGLSTCFSEVVAECASEETT